MIRKMLLIVIFFSLTISLFSLGRQEEVKKFQILIMSADSMEIIVKSSFASDYEKPGTLFVFDSSTVISDFTTYFGTSIIGAPKCGYDGYIDFKKDGRSILEEKVLFSLACPTFIISYNSKYYCVKMTEAGLLFLNELVQNASIQMKQERSISE